VGTRSSAAPSWAPSSPRHDLIDEYRLYVHPVVIGRGRRPLRPSDAKVALDLIETQRFDNGVVLLRYAKPAT
jgi:riboflavin biosynthesis pyrimidine reductase